MTNETEPEGWGAALLDESESFGGSLARSILDASSHCIMVLDLNGHITLLNDAGARLLELENRHSLEGTDWPSLWPLLHQREARDALKAAQDGHRRSFTGSSLSALNKPMWWDVVVTPVRNSSSEIACIVVIADNVTKAKLAFEELEAANKNLDAVLSSTTDRIVVVDHRWDVVYMNEQAEKAVGREGLLAVGGNIWDAYPEQIGAEFHRYYLEAIETQEPVTFEGYLTELDVWLEVRAFPTVGGGLSIFFQDITEAKKSRDEIFRLAHHDSMTGLPNRAMFLKTLERSLQDAVASGTSRAVVYVDLDDFKFINDTFGHDAGDAVIAAAAQRMRECTPSTGLVARIGGDEFAILLREDVGLRQVQSLAMQLKNAFSSPVSYLSTELSCQASFGIALFPDSDDRPSELMKHADLALYEAKRLGGNQYAFYNPQIGHAVQQRVLALSCAKDALVRDAIFPFYQPKVSFETGRVEGFEALLRWTHTREGIQPPSLIKHAFDDPILAIELGDRMLDKVIADMKSWHEKGIVFGSIAINVSAQEFARANFSQSVLERLQAAELPTSLLEIEVTETVFLDDDLSRIERALKELHNGGVSISLDDFGTGYASLKHLNKFPVSWLKIDQSFIRGIGTEPDSMAIVKAVMGLSHSMGIRVVAEGIETTEQWEILKRHGCDLAQGFLISKPLSADAVLDFLKHWVGTPKGTSGR